jgi:hypothetical protein
MHADDAILVGRDSICFARGTITFAMFGAAAAMFIL